MLVEEREERHMQVQQIPEVWNTSHVLFAFAGFLLLLFCVWQGRLCLGSWAQEVDIDVLGLQAELAGKAEEVGKTLWRMTKKHPRHPLKTGQQIRLWEKVIDATAPFLMVRQPAQADSFFLFHDVCEFVWIHILRTLDSFKVFCVSMPSCRSRRCHTEQELKSSLALWDLYLRVLYHVVCEFVLFGLIAPHIVA